jgi:rhamnosyltransferase
MSFKKKHIKTLPKVAVLLATFNGKKYLKSQLDSILKQKGVDVHLYVSDDGSKDGSAKVIQSYCNQFSNISFINKQRIGGAAKNFYYLISHINPNNFDYIALSDQDDVWAEFRLSYAIDQLNTHTADAISSDVIAMDDHGKFIKVIKKSYPQKKFDYFFETPGPGCSFVMSAGFVNYLKSKLDSNAALDDFPYHDWLIYALGRSAKFKWYIDDAPNLFYRQHQNNFIGANYGIASRIKRLNRILFGDYYKELILLNSLLLPEKKLDFFRVWFFIFHFRQTRRNFVHALLMVPFLFILSIQKNNV